MRNLSGKTALVTVASRGIGRASALALSAAGAQVLVHYGRGANDGVVSEIRKAVGRGDENDHVRRQEFMSLWSRGESRCCGRSALNAPRRLASSTASSRSTFQSLVSFQRSQMQHAISMSALSCRMREPAALDDFSTKAVGNSCSCCG
jgi:NAD(P)-dependent dehydrogenase (short-subunit alcohol dehydrogenase family)